MSQVRVFQDVQAIHANALMCAKDYLRAEGALIEAIQKVDGNRVYSIIGYASLFDYARSALRLSEGTAYAFIRVARKCVEIPELKKAIDDGKLTVPQAKRIAAVITPATQESWILKGIELTQRELDREIAEKLPLQAIPERIQPRCAGRLKLELGISQDVERQVRRVQDILSQKMRRAVTLEESLGVLCNDFLKRNDPLEVAKRVVQRQVLKPVNVRAEFPMTKAQRGPITATANISTTRPAGDLHNTRANSRTIPQSVKHQVRLSSGAKCTAMLPTGKVCGASRWLDFHHRTARAEGGKHTVENLTLLCRSHHSAHHEQIGP